jgi:hypothetical protein
MERLGIKEYIEFAAIAVIVICIWALFRFGGIESFQLMLQEAVPCSWFMPALVIVNSILFIITACTKKPIYLLICSGSGLVLLLVTMPYIQSVDDVLLQGALYLSMTIMVLGYYARKINW